MILSKSIVHPNCPDILNVYIHLFTSIPMKGFIRGDLIWGGWVLKPLLEHNQTAVEYLNHIELNGVPRILQNQFVKSRSLVVSILRQAILKGNNLNKLPTLVEMEECKKQQVQTLCIGSLYKEKSILETRYQRNKEKCHATTDQKY